ncbi:site-specific integrase [Arcicella sp. LKC2W]|uniref:tyrosine-type recombinase/integrase n=1 Tax=Arcicella sp. LKC2W TaxID=2984198 RepID=UPI002B205519|nr:site-specific integrase [Arcicella sp. LKC2W]MEA5458728.1 site-specific integrase [Arcicella sp. LKC2W]
MLKVQFFLRGAKKCANPSQNLSIYCQLEIEGLKQDTPFSTEYRVPLSEWWNYRQISSPNGQWVNPDYYTAENINRSLQKIERTFFDIMEVLYLMHTPEDITYKMIREHYDPNSQHIRDFKKEKKVKSFIEVLDEVIAKKLKKRMAKNTIKTYHSRKNNILAFLKKTKSLDIKIDKIRYSFIETFEEWMEQQRNKDKADKYCRNYINKHITLIRQCLDHAVDREYINAMPIGKLNLEYDAPKEPHYLLPEQRQKIIDCKIKKVEQVRDIAVFLMFTGFSYIDYMELTSNHLIGEGFKKARHKTGIFAFPPLLPEVEMIIKKYGSIEELPRLDDKEVNEQLKFLGAYVGLHQETLGYELSTQDFRDTFCSMMENEFMVEGRTLMHMMGHSTMKQIATYSRMMPTRILHDLKKQKVEFLK